MNKVQRLVDVVMLAALILGGWALIDNHVEARGGKTLKGEIYTTQLGDIVEILEVPGFGNCIFANAYVICR